MFGTHTIKGLSLDTAIGNIVNPTRAFNRGRELKEKDRVFSYLDSQLTLLNPGNTEDDSHFKQDNIISALKDLNSEYGKEWITEHSQQYNRWLNEKLPVLHLFYCLFQNPGDLDKMKKTFNFRLNNLHTLLKDNDYRSRILTSPERFDWLKSPKGEVWLKTSDGRMFLNIWSKSEEGTNWLKGDGEKWLKTPDGEAWSASQKGGRRLKRTKKRVRKTNRKNKKLRKTNGKKNKSRR